jgi:hypothetical protein
MLLGYIISQRGIEANPEKVAALERMGPIRDLKGVQRVLGCLAALSRFISQLGEKGLPLYRLLKKHERFSWTTEAQEALDKLKASLIDAPILTPSQDGEPLYLYVAATTQVVSAVIVVERTEEGHALPVQRPMYYISEVLSDTKTRYPQVQKLLYVVVLARPKLRLARGLTPPRARSASLEGSHPLERVPPRSRVPAPLKRAPPRSRLPHECTCPRTWVRAFNALTQQSRAITCLGIMPRRCSANSLGGAHPRHCGGLCDEASVSSVTLCRLL